MSYNKIFPLLLAIFICATITNIHAQNLSGYVKSFGYVNPNDTARFDRAGARLQLQVDGRLGMDAAYFAAMDFNYDAAKSAHSPFAGRGGGLTIYPVEAYVDIFTDHADFRLGQQFIFWGTADWVNPTDNINPWDYENISSEIEDYRIPVMAARGNFYLGPVKLQAVGIPFFEPDKMPTPTDSLITPENRLSNAQFGLKLASYVGTLDYSLSYFHGYDQSPTIRHAGQPVLYGEYLPIDVYGADFITTFGSWAFKGESAYFRTEDPDGSDPFIDNPYLESVVGVDYIPTDKISLTGQLVHNFTFQYDKDVEQLNPQGASPQQTFSTAVRTQWEVMKFVSYQVIGVYNFEDGDSFALTFLNWDMADGVGLTFGGLLFQGPHNSPFGRTAKQDQIFAEVKVSF
ncbi:MAG: hypothetical protein MAGBODY4_00389 [Candidatus Marinimicrobia bacterium]|nr:hypothetical protein [Candidatus Neomarinimicrobiota bacterium]